MFSAPFLLTLLDRVKAIVRRVGRSAAERGLTAGGTPAVPGARAGTIVPDLHGLAEKWMSARLLALSALMARIEAGETLEPRGHAGLAVEGEASPEDPLPGFPSEHLPRGFGWMCGLGPDVRRNGQAFAEWLSEPWMKAMVLAAPERMARLIGPILHATGAATPDWFPVLPEPERVRSLPRRKRSLQQWDEAVALREEAARIVRRRCPAATPVCHSFLDSGSVRSPGASRKGCLHDPLPVSAPTSSPPPPVRQTRSRRKSKRDRSAHRLDHFVTIS